MPQEKQGCIIGLLKWMNFLLIILTGVSFAAPYFSPTTFWPFIFLGLGFPILIMSNIFFVLFWLFKKKWYFLLSLMCLIMSWSAASRFMANPFKTVAKKEGTEIKVMTFNTRGGNIHKKKAYLEFETFIKKHAPDIICFQEINIKIKKFKAVLDEYPYYEGKYHQSIVSKYPILDFKNLELEKGNTGNGAIWADIEVEGSKVRVYNLHLHSNKITQDLDELSGKGLDDINTKENWQATRGILGMVRYAAGIRAKQAVRVKEEFKKSPYPLVVCGDFNDPPQSYSYRILSEGLKDHFVVAGKGFGFTYIGNLPFLKIDYILSSPELHVSDTKHIYNTLSDHKPIVSTVVFQ